MVTKRAPGPVNPSRAAGPPAPASVAATAPRSALQDAAAEAVQGFYAAAEEDGSADRFTTAVVRDHIAVEGMGSADVEVIERAIDEEGQFDPEDLARHIDEIRATRRPVGAMAQKLALPDRRGYKRHWFNDVAGRIDDAKAAGWAHVLGRDRKPMARAVGTGRDKGVQYAFAMEIPEVFWQEDQDAQNQRAQDRMDALKAAPIRAPQGTAQKSDAGKFYSPTDGGVIETGFHK